MRVRIKCEKQEADANGVVKWVPSTIELDVAGWNFQSAAYDTVKFKGLFSGENPLLMGLVKEVEKDQQ